MAYNNRLLSLQSGSRDRNHFVIRKTGQSFILLFAACMALSGSALGVHKTRASHHGVHHRRHLRLNWVLWHPLFRPTPESLYIQNEEIDRLDLPRIQDDAQLQSLEESGDLLEIVPSEALRIAPQLPEDRRYCRPWTLDFLNDLSDDFYNQFNAQIQVNSAVRTVKVQKKLRRHNRNAAPAEGDRASSHLAGITVDIQRRGMTNDQIRWVEQYLLPLKEMGLIEPEEERHQWVFHIMVSDRYDDWRESKLLAGNGNARQQLDQAVESLSKTPAGSSFQIPALLTVSDEHNTPTR
jgi:Family of unknown function (DUF5715)